MVKKSNISGSVQDSDKQQVMKDLKVVEVIPRSSQSSYISVRIANCNIRVTDSTDLTLLRKISEAFDHD